MLQWSYCMFPHVPITGRRRAVVHGLRLTYLARVVLLIAYCIHLT